MDSDDYFEVRAASRPADEGQAPLELRGLRWTFAVGGPSPNDITTNASFSATVAVGGADGFLCDASGSVNTVTDTARFQAHHGGGWSPVGGRVGSSFVTPSFDGTLDVTNGSAVFSASVSYAPISLFSGLINLTSAELAVHGGGGEWGAQLSANARVGRPSQGVPTLSVSGELSSGVDAGVLHAYSTAWWRPLPASLPGLEVPPFAGTLSIGEEEVSAVVTSSSTSEVDIASWLRIAAEEVRVSVNASFGGWGGNATNASSVGSAVSDAALVSLSGNISIGSASDGFSMSGSGWVDTEADRFGLAVHHVGGWSPLDGLLASSFVTPSFDGTLDVTNGAATFSASVSWSSPLVILGGLVTLQSPASTSVMLQPQPFSPIPEPSLILPASTAHPCLAGWSRAHRDWQWQRLGRRHLFAHEAGCAQVYATYLLRHWQALQWRSLPATTPAADHQPPFHLSLVCRLVPCLHHRCMAAFA